MHDNVVFLKNSAKVVRKVIDELDSEELELKEIESLTKTMDKLLDSNVKLGKKVRKALKRFE